MATKKLLELAESTSPDDSDILMIEDTVATKRITFLNLFNKVKAKLALATVATSGKASDLSGLATVATSGKLADTAKDADNRTITDAERAKWNEYGTDITSLNSNYNDLNQYSERDLVEYKLTRLGNVKQFIYNTRIPKEWKANTRFAMNTAAFAVEYRPKATFGTAAVITGTGVVALMDFDADGFIYIKPITTIAVGTWVTIHVCYI